MTNFGHNNLLITHDKLAQELHLVFLNHRFVRAAMMPLTIWAYDASGYDTADNLGFSLLHE